MKRHKKQEQDQEDQVRQDLSLSAVLFCNAATYASLNQAVLAICRGEGREKVSVHVHFENVSSCCNHAVFLSGRTVRHNVVRGDTGWKGRALLNLPTGVHFGQLFVNDAVSNDADLVQCCPCHRSLGKKNQLLSTNKNQRGVNERLHLTTASKSVWLYFHLICVRVLNKIEMQSRRRREGRKRRKEE